MRKIELKQKNEQQDILNPRDYSELDVALQNIYEYVYKNYYSELNSYSIMNSTNSIKENDITKNSRLFKVTQIEIEKEIDTCDCLSTVFSTATSLGNSVVVILDSRSTGLINLYIGIVNALDENVELCAQLLKNAFTSFFPGSKLEDVNDNQFKNLIKETFYNNMKRTISTVSGLSANYEEKNDIKGHAMENFLSTMRKRVFTAIFIIDPISRKDSDELLEGYQNIFSTLSPFAHSTWSYNESSGDTVLASITKGISTNVTESLGKTKGYALSHTDNTFESTTKGINVTSGAARNNSSQISDAVGGGESTTISIGQIAKVTINAACVASMMMTGGGSAPVATAIIKGINSPIGKQVFSALDVQKTKSSNWQHSVTEGITKSISGSIGGAFSKTKGDGQADTYSENYGINQIVSETKGVTEQKSEGIQKTRTEGKTLQIEYTNREIVDLMDLIEKHINKVNESQDCGLYNVGAYFISPLAENSILAANVFKSVKQGKDSSSENMTVNTWLEREEPHYVNVMKEYLSNFVQPIFFKQFTLKEETYIQFMPVSAGTMMSGKEVPLFVDLPKSSVNGITVNEHVEFGHNIPESKNNVFLGNMLEYGTPTQKVGLDIDKLTMHTLITGSTGSGKSNTIYKLLTKLEKERENFHFLVIEPAKGEYKEVLGNRDDVTVYGTNINLSDINMLAINPFSFPSKTIHVLEHMERLIEIFNACWPMYAAMPAVLKEAIERAYIFAGWDLEYSINKYDNELFPDFNDVLREIKTVIDRSEYSADNKGDYTGALVTRIRALTNGINGQIFKSDSLYDSAIFDQNVIIDLSRVGSMETKSLIMGLLILKLQEYRMDAGERNAKLRHITVLEEAHNLLRKTSVEQISEGANLRGKSVEMIANAIAEMRTYGEGFIIADQAPGLLDLSVIRNTNTKIILKLPDYSDRELVGKASGLSESQIDEISKLETGVAVISQSGWIEPVLCKVEKFEEKFENTIKSEGVKTSKHNIDLEEFLLKLVKREKYHIDKIDSSELRECILRSKLSTNIKCRFFEYIQSDNENRIKKFGSLIFDFSNADKAIEKARKYDNIKTWTNCVKDSLDLNMKECSNQQINLILALIINEQVDRDSEYIDILCRFTEIYKRERRVL